MNTQLVGGSVAFVEAILTVKEAAKKLQVSEETVRRMLRVGKLRGITIGRDWRIPESAIVELFGKPPDPPRPPHD